MGNYFTGITVYEYTVDFFIGLTVRCIVRCSRGKVLAVNRTVAVVT
jgi:hypothetical protein